MAATTKLGSLAIKTRDGELMTGNRFPESESMRPVLVSFNMQINCKLPQIMYISYLCCINTINY